MRLMQRLYFTHMKISPLACNGELSFHLIFSFLFHVQGSTMMIGELTTWSIYLKYNVTDNRLEVLQVFEEEILGEGCFWVITRHLSQIESFHSLFIKFLIFALT